MVVGVALDQPLTERVEFFRGIVVVSGEALAGEGVVLRTLVLALLEVDDLEIIRVGGVVGDQVDENGFFLALAVEKKFNVLVQVTPFLGLLRLLGVL